MSFDSIRSCLTDSGPCKAVDCDNPLPCKAKQKPGRCVVNMSGFVVLQRLTVVLCSYIQRSKDAILQLLLGICLEFVNSFC